MELEQIYTGDETITAKSMEEKNIGTDNNQWENKINEEKLGADNNASDEMDAEQKAEQVKVMNKSNSDYIW